MTRTKTVDFEVFINPGRHGGTGDIPALLDMLRYEGGRVLRWTQSPENDLFTVRIQTEWGRYTPERWRSFGIVPVELF